MENTITISQMEYEELLRYKERFMEEASINNKHGRYYKKYLRDKGFLQYIKERDENKYNQLLKDYNKWCKLQEEYSYLHS